MLRKAIVVLIPVLALLGGTVVFNMARHGGVGVKITGTVRLVRRPVPPRREPDNEVVAVLGPGDNIRVTNVVYGNGFTALRVKTAGGLRGYIFKSDSIRIR
mgnify:CR=1 FL=1